MQPICNPEWLSSWRKSYWLGIFEITKNIENKMEKYESGALHPSEVFEMYNSLDIYDKEKFIDMLVNDEDSLRLIVHHPDVEYRLD